MLPFTAAQTNLLVWGLVAHVIGDWLLQNHWIARNKHDLTHLAAWVHSLTHFLLVLPVLPAFGPWVVLVAHAGIDTRRPLRFWGRLLRQTDAVCPGDAVVLHVLFWRDQAAHLLVLAVLAYWLGR